MKIKSMLPVKSMVREDRGALCFFVVDLLVIEPARFDCMDRVTELTIWTIKVAASPTSRTRIRGFIFSRLETRKLKFSSPVYMTKLLNRWNNKKRQKSKPVVATKIFLPIVEFKNIFIEDTYNFPQIIAEFKYVNNYKQL